VPGWDESSPDESTWTERETKGTALGHEILAHKWNSLGEVPARDYENKYLRSKHKGMRPRNLHTPAGGRRGLFLDQKATKAKKPAPADANRNGQVTDAEESAWMRRQQ
jgi:hypothetical protein